MTSSDGDLSLGRGRGVPTRLGTLFVRQIGSGPAAVLWHSLFVDSTTWARVVDLLSAERQLILIDGPGHGRSRGPVHDYDLGDCVGAAEDVLDRYGLGTVDWLGNAWGGHVGIQFAATRPGRCRSLTTVGTPVRALLPAERRQIVAGLVAYRALGPVGPLRRMVSSALLGTDAEAVDVRLVEEAFRGAQRPGMAAAMRSMSLRRTDATALLREVAAPTLLVAGATDRGWPPAEARAAAAQAPSATAVAVPGAGHVAPLLQSAGELAETVTHFWRDPAGMLRSPGGASGRQTG